MEHNANIMKIAKGIIPSLLNAFKKIELCLIGDKEKLEVVAIMIHIYKIHHLKK